MFNFSGSEMVFLLVLALIILGPEKLPDALRKFGKGYAEFKKVTTGFQQELKSAIDEPAREMRETVELFKKAATFEVDPHAPAAPTPSPTISPRATVSTPRPTAAEPAVTPAPTGDAPGDAGIAPDARFPEALDTSDTGTASPQGDDLGASAG